MKRVRLITAAAVLAVAASVAVAAQNSNTSERTFLTFSGAVEMPGVTLQPGTYVFKLADAASRNVVQVWDGDEKNMIGHWLFVPAQRAEVSEDTVVMFKETREGTTPAVQYWYYPGERIGKEFVYPKDQATRIAARTGLDVLSTSGSVDAADARVSSIDAKGNVTEWERESRAARTPTSSAGVIEGSPVSSEAQAESTLRTAPASAQPSAPAGSLAGNRGLTRQSDDVPAAPELAEPDVSASARVQSDVGRPVGTSGQADTQIARADTLPQTAGALPLTGLLGLLSLAGAYAVRSLRRS